jgi:hypothetical protein
MLGSDAPRHIAPLFGLVDERVSAQGDTAQMSKSVKLTPAAESQNRRLVLNAFM